MSAAVMGTPYSPPSPVGHSSDTTSPIYPDRPIRPLPKRPLRSRLSPEVAETIRYPPAPAVTRPLFYLPYNEPSYYGNGAATNSEVADIDRALIEAQQLCKGDAKDEYQFKGNEMESDEEEGLGIIRRYESQQRQAMLSSPNRVYANGNGRNHDPLSQSTVSSNDSMDGYDSFENTNNKKKRKIPTSGMLGNHHSSLSAEMANMGINSAREGDLAHVSHDGGVGQYYGTGSSAVPAAMAGTGISGAGRGRYGRSGRRDASGRSPLGLSVNGSNAWQSGRHSGSRREYTPTVSLKGREQSSDHGIISAAIAEAAALPATPPKGQENVSLLEQQPAKNTTPAKTQFTFTCESDTSKGMVWPGEQNPPAPLYYMPTPPAPSQPASAQIRGQKGFSTQGTQTSPTMAGQSNQNGIPQTGTSQQDRPVRKPRRPPGKRYAMAARERRLQQEYNNYHHPPRDEDIWICEFCEYESIFGIPPEALIRQYEIKDRRERKRLAEKRRLLEKAKMKGRKGKKGNKNSAKNSTSASQAQQAVGQPNYSHRPEDQPSVQNHGTQIDEYFGDDYVDDPMPMPTPPLQAPTKIPQPIGQQYAQSTRTAYGNGTSQGNGTATAQGSRAGRSA